MTPSEQTAQEIVQFLNDHIDRVIPNEWYLRIVEIVGRGEKMSNRKQAEKAARELISEEWVDAIGPAAESSVADIIERAYEEPDAKINLQSAKAEMPEGLWEESCGTVHVAIRILAKQSAELRKTVEMLLASAYLHPKEHPTMAAAWAKAREVLAGQRSTVEPERSGKDYAIEHGGYLATAAQNYLEEKNRYDMAAAGLADEEVADSDSLADHHSALWSAIYEFRKRAERAVEGQK